MDNFDDTKELDFKISERIQDNSLNEEKSGEKDIFSNREEIDFEDSLNPNKDHDKKIKSFLSATIGILVFLVVILIVCIVYFWKNGYISTSKSSQRNNSINSSNQNNSQLDEPNIKFEQKPEDENQLSAETVYNKLAPCVVGVVVYDSEANIISDPISQGSGVIIDEKGYIVTNSHVVNNSKKNNIKIVSNTNEEFSGKVVGYDVRTDLAVIKCEKSGLSCATLGDSDQVKVGESVLALGNPLGLDFASTLTRGIVSAVNRSKSISSNSLVKYIQTDAAINPGNSGGPLINMYGQVIGINSMKIGAAGLEGMGFAVPSNDVKAVVSDIISKGYVSGRVRLGISAMQVTAYQSQMYNVPVGILVHKIYSGSSLESANVQNGDIITKINNIDINSFDTFYGELSKHSPGETISLTVFRRKSSMDSSNKDSTTFNVNVVLLEDRGETQEEEQINSR